MFVHNRFKPQYKLWYLVNLFFKDILILPISLIITNNNNITSHIVINYILVLYLIGYTIISYIVKPLKENNRNDNTTINIINIISLLYVFFNEISLYSDKYIYFILCIVKMVILIILLLFAFIVCYKNYMIDKKIIESKKLDNIEFITMDSL